MSFSSDENEEKSQRLPSIQRRSSVPRRSSTQRSSTQRRSTQRRSTTQRKSTNDQRESLLSIDDEDENEPLLVQRQPSLILPHLQTSEKRFFELVHAGNVNAVKEFLLELPEFNINCVNFQVNFPAKNVFIFTYMKII